MPRCEGLFPVSSFLFLTLLACGSQEPPRTAETTQATHLPEPSLPPDGAYSSHTWNGTVTAEQSGTHVTVYPEGDGVVLTTRIEHTIEATVSYSQTLVGNALDVTRTFDFYDQTVTSYTGDGFACTNTYVRTHSSTTAFPLSIDVAGPVDGKYWVTFGGTNNLGGSYAGSYIDPEPAVESFTNGCQSPTPYDPWVAIGGVTVEGFVPAGGSATHLSGSATIPIEYANGETYEYTLTWDLTKWPDAEPPPDPACSDGIDNDSQGDIDYPADPDCSSPTDTFEGAPPCADGIDNDGDGKIDSNDPGCASDPFGASELDKPACMDSFDNDGDGLADGDDPGCDGSATDNDETNVFACADGLDNDGDGNVDSADAGCDGSATDDDETEEAAACGNELDDDGDGLVDDADPGCLNAADTSEADCRGESSGLATPTYTAYVGPSHLFTFATSVSYCFDGTQAEVLHAAAFGTEDPGIDMGALAIIGFDFFYVPGPESVTWSGNRATLSGEFEITWNVAAAIDKAGLTGKAADKLVSHYSKDLAKLYARFNHNPFLFRREVLSRTTALQLDIREAIADSMKKLDNVLPDDMADDLTAQVLRDLDGRFASFRQEFADTFSADQLVAENVDAYAVFVYGKILADLRELVTIHAWLWSPQVVVEVSPTGTVSVTENGEEAWFLSIQRSADGTEAAEAARSSSADTGGAPRGGRPPAPRPLGR
jgi:hypothetical protein